MVNGPGLCKAILILRKYGWVNDGNKYRVFPVSFRLDDAFVKGLQV